ncbi:MAG: hypothetical protein NT099_00115, partial [Candidatus Saganbacteria bacterium]|nr:hypothetical protein [Candidatus Saganbacteria bacterium]
RKQHGDKDTGSTALNFQRILTQRDLDLCKLQVDGEAFLSTLLDIEEGYGTTTAFAFGALFESGLISRQALYSAAGDLDLFYSRVTATEDFIRKPAEARVKIMERARKDWKPWEYDPRKQGLATVVSQYLTNGQDVVGDCMDMAALNTYLFLRSGIPAGVQLSFEHADNLAVLDGRQVFYRSSEIRIELVPEDRVKPYVVQPFYSSRNFLGAIARITLDRAAFYLEIGMPNQAEALCERAKSIDPVNPETYTYLGRSAALRREYPEALIYLTTAIELGTGNPLVFSDRGEILLAAGRRDEAKADFLYAKALHVYDQKYAPQFSEAALALLAE